MKAFLSKGMSVVVRGGLVGTLVSIVGNSVIAEQPVLGEVATPPETTHEDDLIWEDGQDENRPVLELDPERSYASEALLSFRSKIAPYGKVLGIRRSKESEFRVVQVWKDLEDFVEKCEDDRVMVKVREPWGTELVVSVTINRTRFPGRVRPSVEPPTTPAKPVETPVASKTPDQIPVGKSAEKPATAYPEPKVSIEKVALDVKSPTPAVTTSTSSPSSRYVPQPLEPKVMAMTPEEPSKREVPKAIARPSLTPAKPNSVTPVGSSSANSFAAESVEPKALALTPREPRRESNRPVPTLIAGGEGSFPMTAMLALAPLIPIPAGIKELAGSDFSFQYVKVVGSARKPAVRKTEPSEFTMTTDQEAWLRDAVDVADRMGILSAKPLVTSDRRQNAFALYSLFMALKDYRFEVDLSARQLDEALSSGSRTMGPHRIEAMTRSVEKGMTSIMKWDTRKMESAIRNYSVELSTMGDVRRMVSFLASMQSASRDRMRTHSRTQLAE